MKYMILAALAAMTMMGQDAKIAKDSQAAVSSERPLTETEVLKLQLAASKIENLQNTYKIQEYLKALAPISEDQEAVATAACLSVGVPKTLVKTECALNLPQPGPDGKMIPGKVWWNKPAAAEKK